MVSCPHCEHVITADADYCRNCHRWITDRLIAQTADPNPDMRRAAIDNLVFADRNETSVTALARALSDPVQEVRRAAGAMLFTYNTAAKHAVPALIVALVDDDAAVRRTAAAALSCVGSYGHAGMPRLTELKDTDDLQLRDWVATALERIGDCDPLQV